MVLERSDIEEVGEAVEALGNMVEEELQAINERLGQLHQSIAQTKEEVLLKLKAEMMKTQETVKGVEIVISRTEAKLADLQEGASEEEDYDEELKNDLLIIKKELQSVRSELKEFIERQNHLNAG
jgi:chromosome segregation ATPase